MKKILILTITAIILNSFILSASATTNSMDTGNLTESTFSVEEYLSTNKGDSSKTQEQEYFNKYNDQSCINGIGPISCFILSAIDFATQIIGSIAVLLLIISGFMLMLAQGNQQKLDEAKDITKYAIIGLVITFLSYIITIFIQGLFLTN